ncbi:MAG TPA: hypothetical protein VGH52_01500 [Gaiellaceae bacterium]
MEPSQCSPELIVASPPNAALLVVPSWSNAQLNCGSLDRQFERKEIHAFRVGRIRRDRVDLPRLILATNKAVSSAPTSTTPYDDYVADTRGPFALKAEETITEVEHEVVSLIGERSQYRDSTFQRSECDCFLGDCAFLIS